MRGAILEQASTAASAPLLVGPAPEAVRALPAAVVVFVADWSVPSLAMLRRLAGITRAVRGAGADVTLVVCDVESPLARELEVAVLGWGEASWLVRGEVRERADALASDARLHALTLALAMEA